MRLFKGPRVAPGLAAILVFAALATPCAGANAVFWTGTGATNNISDPANWGGVAPAPGDSLNFLMGHPSVNIDVANASYSSVYISEGLPFTFSGNTMEITGVFLTATSVTFNNPVRLGPNFSLRFAGLSQSVIFSAGSSLTTEGGTISLGASGPPGTIDIQRDITETSPTAMTMIGAPGLPADIYIRGSNGMSGGVTVSSNANLHLGSLASLGSGVPQVWGTILLANPDSSELVIPNSLQLNAGGKLNLSGSGPFRLTGSINSQGGGVVSSVPVTLAGGIFGSFVVGPGAGPFDFQTVTTAPLFVNGTTAHIPASSWASVSVTNGGILRLDASSYDFNSGFTCDATSTIAMTLGGSVINAPSGGGCNFQLTIPPSLAIPASGFIPIAMWTNVQSGSFTSNANFAEGRAVNVNGTTMQVTYHGGYGSALGLVLPVGSGAPRPVTSLTTVTGLKDVSIARGTTKSNFIRAIAGAAGGPSANNQISFTILGGCGSFAGGASSVNVNTDVNGNAVAPSYTAPSNVTV
ncbi:MAG TPA: hypothetical protein VMC79_07580, partial [Rectinemataceae bacterium]|nr:hypothetical protein [Rectinemataceae bacterium]